MLTRLLALIAQSVTLSPAEVAWCEQHFQPLAVRRNTLLEAAGNVPGHLYFVAEGYLRLYYPTEQGGEATTYLGAPGDLLTPFQAFIHQQPAAENLRTITDCELVRIRHAELAAGIAASQALRQFSLWVFERGLSAGTRRADALATRSAEQRYQQLLAQYPNLLLHVPVQYVASYLGIQPESLSRIRRNGIS